ncbi:cyclic GMP-AMP synthase-like receptor [Drosophila tropicalis]|uniref:cyclic GMP-AMP synthase-like receptor n=1 Tax=Drosophila tropicalis TaxID=46794 RepID=UPI0035AC25BB
MSYYYASSSDSSSDSSYGDDSSSDDDFYSDTVSSDESSIEEMSFGEGIQVALENISCPPNELIVMTRDAQIIENTIMKTVCDYNPDFKKEYGGFGSADSFLDGIRIWLPDEHDLNIELRLPLYLQPVCANGYPGFVFLHVIGGDYKHRCVEKYLGNYYFNRSKLRNWLTDCLFRAMHHLASVRVSQRRSYSLQYMHRGDAHNFKAIETSGKRRVISFNFVPSIKFAANQWPRGLDKVPNKNRDWCAVPRNYNKAHCQNDSRSFIISAPDWEYLALQNKVNLKNSLRLMKAFCQANEMDGLGSYMLKSIYLDKINEKPQSNWTLSPGNLLIQMMFKLKHCLLNNKIRFYLDPLHNCLDQLEESDRRQYLRNTNRCLSKLLRRRKADYLTDDDLDEFFGV